jgi:hypothetical protein
MNEHAVITYEYALRAHDSIIATGRLALEQQPEPDATISLGREFVTDCEILPRPGAAGPAHPRTLLLTVRWIASNIDSHPLGDAGVSFVSAVPPVDGILGSGKAALAAGRSRTPRFASCRFTGAAQG